MSKRFMGPEYRLTYSIPPNYKIAIKHFKSIKTHIDYTTKWSSKKIKFPKIKVSELTN